MMVGKKFFKACAVAVLALSCACGALAKEKVILDTGAGRRIGQAMATVFAENGAVVYANDVRDGTVELYTPAVNEAGPGEIRPLYFDIASESEAKTAVMRIKKECGRIDGLVNNAGVEFNELIGMISRENMEKMFSLRKVFSHRVSRYCPTSVILCMAFQQTAAALF